MSWRRKAPPEPPAVLADSESGRSEVDDVVKELRAQVVHLREVTARLELVAQRTIGGLSGE